MRFRGQDKGRGPKWPKPLSAHRFSRDARESGWDVDSPQSPIAPKEKAGTWTKIGNLGVIFNHVNCVISFTNTLGCKYQIP